MKPATAPVVRIQRGLRWNQGCTKALIWRRHAASASINVNPLVRTSDTKDKCSLRCLDSLQVLPFKCFRCSAVHITPPGGTPARPRFQKLGPQQWIQLCSKCWSQVKPKVPKKRGRKPKSQNPQKLSSSPPIPSAQTFSTPGDTSDSRPDLQMMPSSSTALSPPSTSSVPSLSSSTSSTPSAPSVSTVANEEGNLIFQSNPLASYDPKNLFS
jgi:hypothetical protein